MLGEYFIKYGCRFTFEYFLKNQARPPLNSFRIPDSTGYTAKHGHEEWAARHHNQKQHSLVGNIPLKISWQHDHIKAKVVLDLNALIPSATQPQYSRETLLIHRTSHKQALSKHLVLPRTEPAQYVTTPPVVSPKPKQGRSGRRKKIRVSPDRTIFIKPKVSKRNASSTIIQRIQGLPPTPPCRSPPPRGMPGASWPNEECTPQGGGKTTQSRGSQRRAARRRAYRHWRRMCKQQRDLGAGSLDPSPHMLKKASLNKAKWFRQHVLRQQNRRREKKRRVRVAPTTPPLEYGAKLRIATLNVQGFADALKLKTVLQLMSENNLDVVTLSETKSTQYYSYTSEQHLVVLSGNHKDKHAGVGLVIAPKLRPHLADIIQVNSRIIHAVFRKKGGDVHVVGVYAPHSGHDFETAGSHFGTHLKHTSQIYPSPNQCMSQETSM